MEKQLPSFSEWMACRISPQNLACMLKTVGSGSLCPHSPCLQFISVPLFLALSCTLQHLELVIKAVDSAEAELVPVVEAVEAERGGDAVALRDKRGRLAQ